MAKSNAERQAAYRQRHLHDPYADHSDYLARLSMMVSTSAKSRLERLAAYYGITQKSALERALDEAEWRFIETLPSKAQDAYYDRQLTASGAASGERQV